jgi:asparagine synthase (glutamine-hydrolysing)
VVLTGEGSDEHFLGYEFFQRDYVLEPDHSSPGGFGCPSEERRKAILKDLNDDPSLMGIQIDQVSQSTTASRWNNVIMQDYYGSLLDSPVEMYKKRAIIENGVPDSASAMLESISPIARSKARKEWHPAHASLVSDLYSYITHHHDIWSTNY